MSSAPARALTVLRRGGAAHPDGTDDLSAHHDGDSTFVRDRARKNERVHPLALHNGVFEGLGWTLERSGGPSLLLRYAGLFRLSLLALDVLVRLPRRRRTSPRDVPT
jgi:hypothetical protein